jgi:hypothetical protein
VRVYVYEYSRSHATFNEAFKQTTKYTVGRLSYREHKHALVIYKTTALETHTLKLALCTHQLTHPKCIPYIPKLAFRIPAPHAHTGIHTFLTTHTKNMLYLQTHRMRCSSIKLFFCDYATHADTWADTLFSLMKLLKSSKTVLMASAMCKWRRRGHKGSDCSLSTTCVWICVCTYINTQDRHKIIHISVYVS